MPIIKLTKITLTTTKPDGTAEKEIHHKGLPLKQTVELLGKTTSISGKAVCDLKNYGRCEWMEPNGSRIEITAEEVPFPDPIKPSGELPPL